MSADDKLKYRAFVSYAHADVAWARWIQRELETYRIPKAIVQEIGLAANTLRPVFRDSDELGSTSDLTEAIRDALAESEALIVVCSAASRDSTWVNREIEYYLELSPERAKRVYCLLVDGNATDDFAKILPDALSGYEGLAADLRKGGDGRKRALLKLVSALIGVELDRLIQRDRRKRRHRAAAVVTAGAAMILLVTGLVHQSRLSSLEAEERARAADELVTYMLEDLETRLDEFDGVAELDPGFDTALAYFEGIETGDMSNETLERYFDALTSAGDLRLRQGKNAEALRIWERSSEISGRLIERDPANASAWRRHGDSYISLALANWDDPEAIVLNTTQALEHFEKAAQMDPDDFDNHGIQVATLNNLGAGYARRGDFESAQEIFLRSLAMNEALQSKSWPDADDVRERLLRQEAESAGWMTETELRLGRAADAVDWHEREVRVRQEELSNPGNPVRLGDALAWGAVVYESVGDDVTARSKRRESERLFEELAERDPDNFYWQRRYIESSLQRAMADINLGNEALAEPTLANVEQRLDELSTRHADNATVNRLLANMDFVYAQAHVDSSTARSLEHANRAMSRLQPRLQSNRVSVGIVLLHAEVAALAAHAMIVQGMEAEGRELARSQIELIKQKAGGSDYLPNRLVEVILLWLAGEQQRGDALYAQMVESGYQSSRLARWQERLQ